MEKTIVNTLPFEKCTNCGDCMLDVSEHPIYNADEDRTEVEIVIRCKSQNRCIQNVIEVLTGEK